MPTMRAEYRIGSGTYDDRIDVSGQTETKTGTVELAFEYSRNKVTLTRTSAEQLHAALTLLLGLKPSGGGWSR